MGNWIPGVSGLSPGEIADGTGDVVDDVTPDGPVLPENAENAYQLTPPSAVTNAANEYLEGDPVEATDDLLFNVPSFVSGVASGDRENAVLTGFPRDAYDVVADYDGQWGGSTDQYDLPGPSFDLDGNWFGWQSDQAQNDPTRPENWTAGVWMLVVAVVGVGLLYLLRPVLEIIAGVTN